jgi:hypothetical protein
MAGRIAGLAGVVAGVAGRIAGLAGATTVATTAATASASAATTATAAASTATAATAVSTAGPVFTRPRFVDGQCPTVVLLGIEPIDCGLSLGITAHLDEPESFAAAAVAVRDDLGTVNRSELSKHILKICTGNIVAQVPAI